MSSSLQTIGDNGSTKQTELLPAPSRSQTAGTSKTSVKMSKSDRRAELHGALADNKEHAKRYSERINERQNQLDRALSTMSVERWIDLQRQRDETATLLQATMAKISRIHEELDKTGTWRNAWVKVTQRTAPSSASGTGGESIKPGLPKALLWGAT